MRVITRPCMVCKRDGEVEVNAAQYAKYLSGALIQDAFPTMSAGDREQLKTGIHSACWDRMFGED